MLRGKGPDKKPPPSEVQPPRSLAGPSGRPTGRFAFQILVFEEAALNARTRIDDNQPPIFTADIKAKLMAAIIKHKTNIYLSSCGPPPYLIILVSLYIRISAHAATR